MNHLNVNHHRILNSAAPFLALLARGSFSLNFTDAAQGTCYRQSDFFQAMRVVPVEYLDLNTV